MDFDFDEEKRKKKRKRNGFELEQAIEENECPLLVAIEKRCRGVDAISGDIHQELLPVCAAHQLCYLCVSRRRRWLGDFLSDMGIGIVMESISLSPLPLVIPGHLPEELRPAVPVRLECGLWPQSRVRISRPLCPDDPARGSWSPFRAS